MELSVIFCDDTYLLQINRQFLEHDYYTDIITFNYPEDKTAELYISIDRVKENALSFESSFQSELHRVIIHGLLHIAGFKDKTSKQKHLIRKEEDKYLQLL